MEEAATLPCAGVTAWNALVESGGSSLETRCSFREPAVYRSSPFSLRGCRRRVIATSSSDHKLARALEMAPPRASITRRPPTRTSAYRELTAGRGVDQIVEVGGAGTLARSMRAVRIGGIIALIGVLSGVTAEVNPMPILMKNIRVQGIFVGSRTMFEAMNRAIEVAGMHPVIDRVFEFDQAPQALAYLESGTHFGKVVIRV